MWRYMLTFHLVLTVPNVIPTRAASIYSYSQANNQGYPLSIYPIQQQHESAQQSPLQRDGNGFGFQSNYPYHIFAESARNQRNNYIQPSGPPSYAQSQLPLSREQLMQQRLLFWKGGPIVADYASEQYDPATTTTTTNVYPNAEYQSFRNNEYNRKALRSDFEDFRLLQHSRGKLTPFVDDNYYQQNRIGSPSSRDFVLHSAQNSLAPPQTNHYSTAADYVKLFDRYLRKYPERLQPKFNGSGLRK